jgi:hypothetical protein
MYPPVQVSLGRLSFDHTYGLLIPFVPGGAFVLLLMLRRPGLISHGAAELGLGRYLAVAALIFGAYIAGLVFQFLSAALYMAASLLISWRLRNKRFSRANLEQSSQETAWRSIATQFLGETLTPMPRTPMDFVRVDEEWREWYNILQEYLREKPTIVPFSLMQTFMAVEGTGWAIIVAEFAFPTHRHWGLLSVAILSVLLAILMPHVIQLNYLRYPVIQHWQFAARLLRQVRPLAKLDGPDVPKQ